MNRVNLWRASLLMIALTAIACGEDLESTPEAEQASTLATRQDAVFSQFKALILDRTVVGGADSVEAAAARRLGLGGYRTFRLSDCAAVTSSCGTGSWDHRRRRGRGLHGERPERVGAHGADSARAAERVALNTSTRSATRAGSPQVSMGGSSSTLSQPGLRRSKLR